MGGGETFSVYQLVDEINQEAKEREKIARGTQPWLSLSEVALWAGLERTVVWRAIKRGTLRASKLGAHWYVRRSEAADYVEGPRPIRKPKTRERR